MIFNTQPLEKGRFFFFFAEYMFVCFSARSFFPLNRTALCNDVTSCINCCWINSISPFKSFKLQSDCLTMMFRMVAKPSYVAVTRLTDVIHAVPPQDWFMSVELHVAYFPAPITLENRCFLRISFQWLAFMQGAGHTRHIIPPLILYSTQSHCELCHKIHQC